MGVNALNVCGEFVGRAISGLCSPSPEVWAILLVTMHEVQQREEPAQPAYRATTYCSRPVSARTVPCLTSGYGVGGAFSFSMIGESCH